MFGSEVPLSVSYFSDSEVVLDALQGMFTYLDTILIRQRVLESARFFVYDPESARSNYMILDSQSLYHLEVLSSTSCMKEDYSLFGCLDRTVSPGGRRLLRKWVCAPLQKVEHIVERQDAVEDLIKHLAQREAFRKVLKGLPDLER
jgi:DNA mismatch repair protein MSH6